MAAASTQKDATDPSNHADGAPEHVLVNVLMQPQDFEKPASAINVNACIREAYLAMTENDWDRSGESGWRTYQCGSWNNWSQQELHIWNSWTEPDGWDDSQSEVSEEYHTVRVRLPM